MSHAVIRSHGIAKKGEPQKPKEEPKKPDRPNYVDKDGYEDTAKSHHTCAVNLATEWTRREFNTEAVVKLKGCLSLRLWCIGVDKAYKECIYSVSVDGQPVPSGKWQATAESPERTVPASASGQESRFEVKVHGVR